MFKATFTLSLLSILCSGCVPGLGRPESPPIEYIGSIRARDLTDLYFPRAKCDCDSTRWAAGFSWFSAYLAAMDEPPLCHPCDSLREEFRILELGGNIPDVLLIEKIDTTIRVGKKKLVADSRNQNGARLIQDWKKVSRLEWERVQERVSSLKFWSLSVFDDHAGVDGVDFVIEGVRGSEYHFIDRWSPEDRRFAELAQEIFDDFK